MRRELIVSADPGEWRAALVEDGAVVELRVERGDGYEAGSVHLGRILRQVPGLGAALVDMGGDRPAFLPQSQIFPRGRRLDEGERVVVQIRREAQGGKAPRLTMAMAPPGRSGELSPGRRWQEIGARSARLEPPARLYPEATLAAALAGALPAIDRVVTDEPGAIPEIRAAFPDVEVVNEPESRWPIDLDALFDEALSPVIAVPGGGSVHFEPARAATLIDVDTGTPETGSPERTALAINLAAAAVIARQLRLRPLGGSIVVDFVGLDDRAARDKVRTALARAVAADPARPEILGWTRLGHLELVRPRRLRLLGEVLLDTPSGGNPNKTAVAIAHEALRQLRREERARPGHRWRLTVAPDVKAALTGLAASAVHAFEQRSGRKIAIADDPSLARGQFQISPA